MSSYGQRSLGTVGARASVFANADGVWPKTAGITLDWATVAAVGADTTYWDGTLIENGKKALPGGQVVIEIGVAEVQTVTISGSPTGGTFTLTLPAVGDYDAQTTAALAYNASAATVQAALEALSRIGIGNVAVGLSGAVYTVTFQPRVGDVPQLTSTNALTGGTSPALAHATSTPAGTSAGKFGPYDPAATDGRATLARGRTFFLDKTVREDDPASDHPAAYEGGRVFQDRMLMTTGTHSLALGPTVSEFQTVFPLVTFVTRHPY
jgi:hypothetical protein